VSAGRLTPPVGPEDNVRGGDDAPVTLVEYGDYECPHCARAHPIVERVRRRLGDRLRFVFRDFPLGEMHPHAVHAAEAAAEAAAQGRFWEMHDTLFKNQDALDDRALVRHAESLGLDGPGMARALAEGTHEERVRAEFMSGVRSGVNGTPTFFINGRRHDGAYDVATLSRAVKTAGAHSLVAT
jgi:protein-disulfide isomerase